MEALPPQLPREELECTPAGGKKEIQRKLEAAVYAAFASQKVILDPTELESMLSEVGFPDEQTISALSVELEKRRTMTAIEGD